MPSFLPKSNPTPAQRHLDFQAKIRRQYATLYRDVASPFKINLHCFSLQQITIIHQTLNALQLTPEKYPAKHMVDQLLNSTWKVHLGYTTINEIVTAYALISQASEAISLPSIQASNDTIYSFVTMCVTLARAPNPPGISIDTAKAQLLHQLLAACHINDCDPRGLIHYLHCWNNDDLYGLHYVFADLDVTAKQQFLKLFGNLLTDENRMTLMHTLRLAMQAISNENPNSISATGGILTRCLLWQPDYMNMLYNSISLLCDNHSPVAPFIGKLQSIKLTTSSLECYHSLLSLLNKYLQFNKDPRQLINYLPQLSLLEICHINNEVNTIQKSCAFSTVMNKRLCEPAPNPDQENSSLSTFRTY